jgi:hypothetical protein
MGFRDHSGGTHVAVRSSVRLAILLVLGLTSTAAADDSESYAEQVIAADMAAASVTLGGEATGHTTIRDAGLGLSIGAAPLVHLANGNRWGAAKSLALHITLPLATTLVVDRVTENKTTTMLAFAAGMAVATAFDAATIAKKKKRVTEWRPDLAFKSGGVQLRVGRKF